MDGTQRAAHTERYKIMATRKSTKASPRHDAHVTEYWHNELNAISANPLAPAHDEVVAAKAMSDLAHNLSEAADKQLNVTLEEALAESNETIEELKEEAAPAKIKTGRVDRSSVMYAITDKAQGILPIETLQRGCTVAVGATWRQNEFKAPNTRVAAIEALYEAADEEGMLTHAQAMEALKPLKDQALLGSGTPASYIREFVRVEYLTIV